MAKKLKNRKYANLGLVIDTSGVVNNDYAMSDIFYGYDWVKSMIFKFNSSHSYNAYIRKINFDDIEDGLNTIGTGFGATGATNYGWTLTPGTSGTPLIGHAFRVVMQNKSGGATATFKCYVEVKC